MTYRELQQQLKAVPKRWLITGAAGFIGSNLLERLLRLDQVVIGLDNFSSGHNRNLEEVRRLVSPTQWKRFAFTQGDVRDVAACRRACEGVDFVLHQAALGSVPRSIKDPVTSHDVNVTGFLNMLVAARDCNARRFVYASSSSVYGDSPDLPKREQNIASPLSPYALTKLVNELTAETFARCYGTESIGLRYFNVFGPRQDPEGPYAAVIPKWILGMLRREPIELYGDGETSRDFCFVENVVQANVLAAMTADRAAVNQVYNVAFNERTTLNQLYHKIKDLLTTDHPYLSDYRPAYKESRLGDVRHSQADISRAARLLGYQPTDDIREGLSKTLAWYKENARENLAEASHDPEGADNLKIDPVSKA
jgi:UDP-N-acetylglucosamine 4-epimerase